jgi:hypothetical protein
MRRWRETIDIKPLIHRDQMNTDPGYVANLGKEVASLIRTKTVETDWSMSLEDALETMEDIDPEDDDAADMFNGALSELYDWADRERIWLGV